MACCCLKQWCDQQGNRKLKEISTRSGSKATYRSSKSAEREGRPGLIEVIGNNDGVNSALQMIWDLLQEQGKEYKEVPLSKYNLQ